MKKVENKRTQYQYKCWKCQNLNNFESMSKDKELLFGGKTDSAKNRNSKARTVYVESCQHCGAMNRLEVEAK